MNIKFTIILTVIVLPVIVFFAINRDRFLSAGLYTPPLSPIADNKNFEEPNMAGSFVIKMDKSGFFPRDIEISQGATVFFENIDKKPHWPASNIHPSHQV